MAEEEGERKNPLLIAAEKIARERATMSGYLRKKNSADKLQKRYFLILPGGGGISYFVYYKSNAADVPMLAAMDLSRAGRPELLPASSPEGDAAFSIMWDRQRSFQAGSRAEAGKWVEAILAAQAEARKAGLPSGASTPLPFSPSVGSSSGAEDWKSAKKPGEGTGLKNSAKGKSAGSASAGGGGGCCTVM